MAKCLDCGNTKTFIYMENSYNEAVYGENGELEDVTYKEYEPIKDQACKVCESTNVEGVI